ncbi:MAG: ketol-acid reductoisomerase [Spirochaeta sp. LUC14_002_19_P3]|nr:MAG: ketol-acid reductoisomerase [Spirochaeta sp. LUC14_002_19_P3]
MNYFSGLPFREQVRQLGTCRFMEADEFHGTDALKGAKIVILGCGAQGLHQGLNLRDSGLDVSYALRADAIAEKRLSWKNATENSFTVGTFEELVPKADVLMNLTPDKQHSGVTAKIMPLMKKGAALGYSHGFNIVEEGMKIREDITVIMVAPKSPGTEVREEYKRGFGVPTLIAVHPENDPQNKGWDIAKAYASGLGSDRAGVLASSFVAEVKSDLMGEQTILCGMLQTGTLLCYDMMLKHGIAEKRAASLVQYGWEGITEALKHGGITNMMDRLSNPAKIRAFELAEDVKKILANLYLKHIDDILSGTFSREMMEDWKAGDKKLLAWREETGAEAFEKTSSAERLPYQVYFDCGVVMVALVKAGVELAFEVMATSGIKEESAYYESLHELPLIANLVSRKKLYEMNRVISDTAEYGNYLFSHACIPLLRPFISALPREDWAQPYPADKKVDDEVLIRVNAAIRNHPIEIIGKTLRTQMKGMKALSE